MKWLFSITYFSPYVSGLTIYVKRLAEELVKRNNEVTVLSMKHDPSLKSEEFINGVKVKRSKILAKINKGFISTEWFINSWREVRNSDVVVANLPQAEGWVPGVWAKLFGKKLIAIYHCEIDIPNKLVQWILEQANWACLDMADRIVTYTEDYAKNSKLLRKYLEKVSYVYPPIPELKVDANLRNELAKKIGEGPVIGVAARLAREKGIEFLFEAIPMIKTKVKIAIAGPLEPVGENEYKNKILKLAKKNKDQIVFLGTIDPEKMGSFYDVIDILVLPSINSTEAFGMVQVEAMMQGVPVVASDLPGVRLPIQETGMGIIVPPKKPAAIAEAVDLLLKNKTKYDGDPMKIKKEFDLGKSLTFWEELSHEV